MKLNLFIAIFLVITTSCTHFETEALNNQYLYVKSTTYKNGNSSGFNNGNITDLHVNVDGTTTSFLRIPQAMTYSIENETSSVFFFPAVQLDGNKSTTTINPFLEKIEKQYDKNVAGTDTVNLEFDYKDDVNFIIREGFENFNSMNKNIDNDSETNLVRIEGESFEGNYYGKMELTQAHPEIIVGSDNSINITNWIDGLYAEITYKSEAALFIGLSAKNISNEFVNNFKIYLVPQKEWNTVYIDLSEEYSSAGSSDVRFALKGVLDDSNGETASIYIDNIKLMYR